MGYPVDCLAEHRTVELDISILLYAAQRASQNTMLVNASASCMTNSIAQDMFACIFMSN